MEDEVAKCIAEGAADRMLDALEKKVKRQMGDASEDEIPAGLGKFYFCRVEDLKNNPDAQPIPLGEAVSIKPGMLTYKDDGDAKPYYSAKGFKATLTGTMEKPSDELMALLKKPLKWDVKLERQLERMPRKMKKAHRSDYPRNTKWIRKVANYLRRMTTNLHNGEMVVTREQMGVLEATIKGSSLQYNPDAVAHVSGKDIKEATDQLITIARGHHIRNADGTITDVSDNPKYKCKK